MGHKCCTKLKVKRGLWSPEEDEKLITHVTTHGHSSWSSVPKLAGLQRCGKSCRLRWINYLRPDLKRGSFTDQEEQIIIDVHRILGNRWAQIAKHLPGRTDNEVKNFWNSCIKKKLISQGLDPKTHNLFPSHQRPSINKVTISQTHQQQQPISPFTLNTTQNILEASMTLNPPFLMLPSPDSNVPMAMSTSEYQKNPNLVPSSIESLPISSSSPSSGNPSGFGLLEDNYCFWGTDIETLEAPRLLEGLLQPQGQDNQHQLMIMKECNGEVQADKIMDEIKGAGDQDVDGSIFDNSTFDLVTLVSAAMSSDLTSMDSTLVWNF